MQTETIKKSIGLLLITAMGDIHASPFEKIQNNEDHVQ